MEERRSGSEEGTVRLVVEPISGVSVPARPFSLSPILNSWEISKAIGFTYAAEGIQELALRDINTSSIPASIGATSAASTF